MHLREEHDIEIHGLAQAAAACRPGLEHQAPRVLADRPGDSSLPARGMSHLQRLVLPEEPLARPYDHQIMELYGWTDNTGERGKRLTFQLGPFGRSSLRCGPGTADVYASTASCRHSIGA